MSVRFTEGAETIYSLRTITFLTIYLKVAFYINYEILY